MTRDRDIDETMSARCRFCSAGSTTPLISVCPRSVRHTSRWTNSTPERFFPLHVWFADECFLVQLEKYVAPEQIFDYGFFLF